MFSVSRNSWHYRFLSHLSSVNRVENINSSLEYNFLLWINILVIGLMSISILVVLFVLLFVIIATPFSLWAMYEGLPHGIEAMLYYYSEHHPLWNAILRVLIQYGDMGIVVCIFLIVAGLAFLMYYLISKFFSHRKIKEKIQKPISFED